MKKIVTLGSSKPSKKKKATHGSLHETSIELKSDQIENYRSRLTDVNYMNHAIKKIAMELLHFLAKEK